MLSNRVIKTNQSSLNKAVKPVYYGLLLLGIVLRLIPYFLQRSLWLDEASLSLNITDRNFTGLLHPLDYNQVAPVLFLLIEKGNILLFGNSELSLRLLPLLCGLFSLPLIYRLTKALSGNSMAGLVALFMFAVSPVLISYSNEVKQYETDVFSALCLLTLVFDTSFSGRETKRYILLALAGLVLIFLSNAAVLVLFTIGVYYLLKYGAAIFKMPSLIVVFVCWAIFFLVYYRFFIYHHPLRTYMMSYWQNDFMPVQIFSSAFWSWLNVKFLSIFKFYSLPFLAVFILSAVVFIVRKQWLFLYFLLVPIVVHFILSGFKLYPFETRLVLYLAAFITPVLAIGLVELIKAVKKRITIYPVAILLMLLVYSLIAQLVNMGYPFWKEETKRSIDFINSDKSPGQKVYVYYASIPALMYYVKTNRVPFKDDLIWGTDDWGSVKPEMCFNDIGKLKGMVWLLFSHIYPDQENIISIRLAELHISVLKTFKTHGSSAYLVKLNTK